jgi:beta-lactamase regulating signal transducer with metallopeptidase domain
MQLRCSARPLDDPCLQVQLREIAVRLGFARVPLLLVSSRTVTPVAVGFGRPAVLLPKRLLGVIEAHELRDVLVHEMAHLKRGDQRMVLLQELAAALYWPILSLHLLNRELQRAREEVCDNVVLAGRDALRYGETLLHIAEVLVKGRRMRAVAGIFGGPGKLERRIAGLIDPRRNLGTTTGRKAACAVMLLFLALGVIASATRFIRPAGVAPAPPVQGAPEPSTIQEARSAADPGDSPVVAGGNGCLHLSGPSYRDEPGALRIARVMMVESGSILD